MNFKVDVMSSHSLDSNNWSPPPRPLVLPVLIIRSVNRYFAASDEDKTASGYLRYHINQIHPWKIHQTILKVKIDS